MMPTLGSTSLLKRVTPAPSINDFSFLYKELLPQRFTMSKSFILELETHVARIRA